MTIGKTYHYFSFPFKMIQLPRYSGSPIIQNNEVVGILASVFYINTNGLALYLEEFRNIEFK